MKISIKPTLQAKLNGVISRGIKEAYLENGHLFFTLTDNTTVDVGKVNGIKSCSFADYKLTLTFEDGSTFTTGNLRGEKGERGEQGIQGERGIQGETGNGIANAVLNDDYTLTITFTDGSSYTTPSIRGEKGERGEQGIQGERGIQGEQGVSVTNYELVSGTHAPGSYDTYRMTLSNGESFDCMVWNGANGEGSGDMLATVYDPKGGARQVAFADELPSLSAYRTADEQDKIHDGTKQDTLTDTDKQAIADLHKDAVESVNGKTGAVELTSTDIKHTEGETETTVGAKLDELNQGLAGLAEWANALGLSVVDGAICVTYTEEE